MSIIQKGRIPKVVIIDSGIDLKMYDLYKNVKQSSSYKLDTKGNVIEDNAIMFRHPHGTAIAMIIKRLFDKVEIFNMNILDENLMSDGRILIHALKKAIEIKPDIIHLSLGTTKLKYKYALSKIIKNAEKNNIIVVSAYSNDGKNSYPAALKHVIGVKSSEISDNYSIYFNKNIFYAPPIIIYDELECFLKYKRLCGNSIAAAYIAGYMCKIINSKQNINNKELTNHLIEKFTQNNNKINGGTLYGK